MSRKLLTVLAVVGASLAFSAKAAPIQVAYDPVTTQPADFGSSHVATWAASAIADFNTAGYPGAPLPALPAETLYLDQTALGGANINGITLDLTGFVYIVMGWGGTDIVGDKGTADYLYYVNGTSSWTFYNAAFDGVKVEDSSSVLASGGVSGFRGYGGSTSVPDGGATAVLLGAALIAVSFVARRKIA